MFAKYLITSIQNEKGKNVIGPQNTIYYTKTKNKPYINKITLYQWTRDSKMLNGTKQSTYFIRGQTAF